MKNEMRKYLVRAPEDVANEWVAVTAPTETEAVEEYINGGKHTSWHEDSVGERVLCEAKEDGEWDEDAREYDCMILNTYDVQPLCAGETYEDSGRFELASHAVRARDEREAVMVCAQQMEWDAPKVRFVVDAFRKCKIHDEIEIDIATAQWAPQVEGYIL